MTLRRYSVSVISWFCASHYIENFALDEMFEDQFLVVFYAEVSDVLTATSLLVCGHVDVCIFVYFLCVVCEFCCLYSCSC